MAQNFRKSWGKVLSSVDKGVQSLARISLSPGGRDFLSSLDRGEAGICLELLDRGLTKHSLDQATRQSVLIVVIELSKRRRRLPDSIMITEKTMAEEEIHTSGRSSEIRRGTLSNSAIAIKTPRFSVTTDIERIRERFCREVILWSTMSHPNILKLAGVLGSIDTSNFSTVSEWMTHESLVKYIKDNDVDRLKLIHGIAQGLKYMHDINLIHGAVKASNILITNESPPRPCLSGFGSIFIPDREFLVSEAEVAADGVGRRYLAPELIYPSKFGLKEARPSREADVYAFGLLVLEVLTGKVPFDGTKGAHLVCAILKGDRPAKPENAAMIGLSDPLWELLQACWDADRLRRPQMHHVETQVGNAAGLGATIPRGRPFPRSRHSGDFIPGPLVASSSSSSSRTKKSSASDQPRLIIPEIRIEVAEPEEDNPRPMQEFYPPPSPVIPTQPEHSPNEAMIDRWDGVLIRDSIAEQERARVLNNLCKLCYRHRNVPELAKIADCHQDCMPVPVWHGEFSSVFKGSYQNRPVAVKVMQLYAINHELTLRRFCKEAVIWRHLRHPSILPLVGITISPVRCSMVSDWMENGTVNQFVAKNPDANRIDLLIDAVEGLMYLHKIPIVHGDLKGVNILVNQSGHACLADFGLSTVVGFGTHLDHLDADFSSANQRDSLMSFIEGGTYPWMSPELLGMDVGNGRPTKESDIYALGMVIYEVLCGTIPFGDLAKSIAIVVEIMKGTRPGKPDDAASLGFTDELWGIVKRCWLVEKHARPALGTVLSCLKRAASSWNDRWEVV